MLSDLCQLSFAYSSLPKASETLAAVQGWISHPILDFSWMRGEGGGKDQECQYTLPRTRGSVLACRFMHVFSDVLHLYTSPSILSIHCSWKAQYDISWFPLLAGEDSRNFKTKPSAINTVLAAWGLKIDIKSSCISCWSLREVPYSSWTKTSQ